MSTPLTTASVIDALHEIRSLVAADGADIEFVDIDTATSTVHLRLIIDGVECRECVLPGPMLEEVVAGILRASLPELASVSIADPRDDTQSGR
jgi:Fe-S cluster biogenesis protein NfuA